MTGDAPSPEQLRRVPLATLRGRARRACERRSVRAVAAEMGVGRTTLRNFVYEGTTPHPRVRRLVALWFVSQPADREVEEDACEILLAAVPAASRALAQEELIIFVKELHQQYGPSGVSSRCLDLPEALRDDSAQVHAQSAVAARTHGG
jgi:hypothetical protein